MNLKLFVYVMVSYFRGANNNTVNTLYNIATQQLECALSNVYARSGRELHCIVYIFYLSI